MRFLVKTRLSASLGFGAAVLAGALVSSPAFATVFNIPEFVPEGKSAFGLEPVLTLSDGAGIGVNARYTQGLSDLIDASLILGTGSGPRRFRVGGNLVFDFVPDVQNQPGIGIAVQPIYYRLPNAGMLEVTGIPYIHKAFNTGGATVDPFVAFPIGFDFSDGNYNVTSTLALGANFKETEHVTYTLEVGVEMNHSESYISGGVTYYP
ncbi:MAG: hypothetical protein P4M08_13205 [Oligoflexia bacterium]|nr:hypothetical protein [Oligoflexia bacterium]